MSAKIPHKKHQLASRAAEIIARRRAKWLATQRGSSNVEKRDIAAGRQFAEGFLQSVIANPFWMQSIGDISKSLSNFVKLAERQGAPLPPPKGAPQLKTQVSPEKIEIIRAGLLEISKLHGKEKAREIFVREGIPIRPPGSANVIAGWIGNGDKTDLVYDFWASPLEEIKERVAVVVEKAKNLPIAKTPPSAPSTSDLKDKPTEEQTVSGTEAPPRKRIYSASDFMPTADDMIGLAPHARVSMMGAGPFGRPRRMGQRPRAITKKKYEALVVRLAHRIAARSNRKPTPAEFALAKKQLDTRLKRSNVRVAGELRMGISDIMAASYIIGAAAAGSPAAQLAIMKSVEAAKEGHVRGKKAVKALQIAKKKMQTQKAKQNGAANSAKPLRRTPRRKVKGAKPNGKSMRQRRLLRSFYRGPYPRHPAFKIHDI